MKTNVKRFPDELAYQILQEYLTTDISQSELKKKYNFGGNGNIYRWMRKFGVSKPDTSADARLYRVDFNSAQCAVSIII